MPTDRVALTRERLALTDQRIRELHDRLFRLRAGKRSTPEDVRRARHFAELQGARAERAQTRLDHLHAAYGLRNPEQIDTATMPSSSTEVSTPEQAAYERTRDGLASVLLAQVGASPDDERYRALLLGTIERARHEDWHGWAQALCAQAASMIPDAKGVAISLDVAGMLVPFGWSDGWSRSAEELHQTLGEGPPVAARHLGRSVAVESVWEDPSRWPTWAGAADQHQVRALRAFPLPVLGEPIGAMTFYWRRPDASATTLADALLVVELAGGFLWADADRIAKDAVDDSDGIGAVAVAAGMIAARLEITVEAALARIRAHAFANGSTIRNVSQAIIDQRDELS